MIKLNNFNDLDEFLKKYFETKIKKNILTEKEFLEGLNYIIQRDFYPNLFKKEEINFSEKNLTLEKNICYMSLNKYLNNYTG